MRRFSARWITACALTATTTGWSAGAETHGEPPAQFAYTAPSYSPPSPRTRPRSNGDDDVSRRIAEADRLAGQREWDKAASVINTLLAQFPDDMDLLSRSGHYYMMKWSYAVSESYWSRLATLHPDNAWALACWGGVLVRMGQREQAQDALDRSLKLNPHEIVARLHVACLRLAAGEPAQARAALGSMNLLEIGNCATWVRDDAIALEKMMGIGPLRDLCGMVLSGGESQATGGVDLSSMDMRALRETMDRAAADLWSSYQALQRKEWAAAETNLATAVAHGIRAPAATQGAAYCRVMLNDPAKAFDLMSELAASYPDSAFVQFKFGLLCMDQERYEMAAETFRRAHRISPDDQEITVNLAGAQSALSRAEDAWNVLDAIPASARPAWASWFDQPRPYARNLKQDPRYAAWVTKLQD